MSHLTLGEVGRHIVGLEMAHPAVPECVHSAAWYAESVADRIKHQSEDFSGEWRGVAGLEHTASGAGAEMLPQQFDRA